MKKLSILFLLLLPLNAFAMTVNTGGFDRDWKAVEQCIQKAVPDHENLLKDARVDLFYSTTISPVSGIETEYLGVITMPGLDFFSSTKLKAAWMVPACMDEVLMWNMLLSFDSGTDRLIYFIEDTPSLAIHLIFESRGHKTIYIRNLAKLVDLRDSVMKAYKDKTPRRLSATYSPPDYTKGVSLRDHNNFVEFMEDIKFQSENIRR